MSGLVLVMAKAPVPGRVKTRLGRSVGDDVAAHLALLALVDTVTTCTQAFGAERCRLALDGDLDEVTGGGALSAALTGWTVVPQRGDGLAERIVAAHADVFDGRPLLQIGMDTPQLTDRDLLELLSACGPRRVALGPATDGGWWGIAHQDLACLDLLTEVAMSDPDTGVLTRDAAERAGFEVVLGAIHRDVDTVDDALAVAAEAPLSLFALGVKEQLTTEVAP